MAISNCGSVQRPLTARLTLTRIKVEGLRAGQTMRLQPYFVNCYIAPLGTPPTVVVPPEIVVTGNGSGRPEEAVWQTVNLPRRIWFRTGGDRIYMQYEDKGIYASLVSISALEVVPPGGTPLRNVSAQARFTFRARLPRHANLRLSPVVEYNVNVGGLGTLIINTIAFAGNAIVQGVRSALLIIADFVLGLFIPRPQRPIEQPPISVEPPIIEPPEPPQQPFSEQPTPPDTASTDASESGLDDSTPNPSEEPPGKDQ